MFAVMIRFRWQMALLTDYIAILDKLERDISSLKQQSVDLSRAILDEWSQPEKSERSAGAERSSTRRQY